MADTSRSTRSLAPLTLTHLHRLGELAESQHAEYTRPAGRGGKLAAWSRRRVAVVLAQGAARHFLHPDAGYGVKDLDVWTFYARHTDGPLYPGRYEVHRDFGRSSLGRNLYRPPLNSRERRWDAYHGRRVDFLVRELPVAVDADVDQVVAALRAWLGQGAEQRCRHAERKNSSAHWLAHKAMVWIGTPETREHVGRRVWDSELCATHLL